MARHFNKHEVEALGAQAARRKRVEDRMCRRKTGYATREQAAVCGAHAYERPFCYLWHSTNSAAMVKTAEVAR